MRIVRRLALRRCERARHVAALETLAGTVRITGVEAIPFAVPYRRAPEFASGTREQRGQRARARAHRRRPRRPGRGAAAPVHLRRDAGVDRRRGRRRAQRRRSRASIRCASSWSPSAAPALAGNYVARGAVDLAVWDLDRPDPRPAVPHAAGRLRGRRRGGAHGVASASRRRWPRRRVEVHERLGVTHLQGQGRARRRSSTSRRSARSARRCPTPISTSTPTAAGATTTRVRAGDALVELGVRAIEEPISIDDRAGRLRLAERWDVPLARRRELHQPRARRPRARGGRGPRGERQDGADRVHRVAPDPRSLPRRATSPVVVGSQYEGAIGAPATIAFAAAFAATAGQPGRDHELPRPRRRPRRRRPGDPRRPRDGAAPRRASASRSTRTGSQHYRLDR